MRIQCVVENSAQLGSPLWGEHGVAFHIQTPDGQLLFDTGASGQVFLHNAERLEIDLARLDAIALSHAHYDHTGGLGEVLPRCRQGLPLHASPDLFRERYARRKDAQEYRSIGLPTPRAELERYAELRLSAEPAELLPGVWTTGEIGERPFFQGSSPHHAVQQGDGWRQDPYRDDLSLVLETGAGLVVVCGCCHAGLLNVLAHVRRRFDGEIVAVLGGTHLGSATDAMLQQAVAALRDEYGAPRLYPNHCTGMRAYLALAAAFGERVQPCPAGTALAF